MTPMGDSLCQLSKRNLTLSHHSYVLRDVSENHRFWHSTTGHLAGASERADTAESPPLCRELTERRAGRSARVAPDDKRLISMSGFGESSSWSTKRPIWEEACG